MNKRTQINDTIYSPTEIMISILPRILFLLCAIGFHLQFSVLTLSSLQLHLSCQIHNPKFLINLIVTGHSHYDFPDS
jgi:hypothetical protein